MVHLKRTRQSEKAIEELKHLVILSYPKMNGGDILRISKHPTKKKTITAVITKINVNPSFDLFVNEKYFSHYTHKNGKWSSF